MDNRKEIAEKIITALTNRSGFNDLWYNLDEDIQTEITDEIVNILPIPGVSLCLPNEEDKEKAFYSSTNSHYKKMGWDRAIGWIKSREYIKSQELNKR